MFKHILLATDGSPASRSAVQVAVKLASEQRAALTALYVVDPFPYLGIGDTNPMGLHAYLAAARVHAAAAHSRVMEEAASMAPAVEVQPCLVEDVRAADGIAGIARDRGADLIVAGSHGRGGLDRMLLGSVTRKLLAIAQVPVLVVRPGQA